MIWNAAGRSGKYLIASLAILLSLLVLNCGERPKIGGEGPEVYKGIRIGGRDSDSYQAFRNGGGPLCGTDSAGQEVFCPPRSYCTSPEKNTCIDSRKLYHAFRDGGGPLCGTDSAGQEVFCQPRTNCVAPEKNHCQDLLRTMREAMRDEARGR